MIRRPERPGWPGIVACGLLPGLLAGAHLAGLVFFLNPELPFSGASVGRGVLLYGGLFGAASMLLLLPLFGGRPDRAGRILPWGITCALAGAALLDWAHASYFAYLLPPGINQRLIKTALWLSLGGVIAFYIALLHALRRRPYGGRSRIALAAVSLLSVVAMLERRDAFEAPRGSRAVPAVVDPEPRPGLWVIGLDGATLDAVLPLASEGKLPFFAAALADGAYGRLESITPTRKETLWTTVATGKLPYKHGVLGAEVYPADALSPGGELSLLPKWIGFRRWGTLGRTGRPPDPLSRTASTAWEILWRLGRRAGVTGWPATFPATSEATYAVTDRFFLASAGDGAARPASLAERARQLAAPAPMPEEPASPAWLGAAALDDRWRLGVAEAATAGEPPGEAAFLFLPGLAGVSERTYGGFEAAQFSGSRADDDRQAAERLTAYYQELDRVLGELWESRALGRRLLAVVSANGIGPRGSGVGGRATGRRDGLLILRGEGIRSGAILSEARLVDVVPTLLYWSGYPVARDFDGQVLTAAFSEDFLNARPLAFLPTYEWAPRPAAPAGR